MPKTNDEEKILKVARLNKDTLFRDIKDVIGVLAGNNASMSTMEYHH